jgi:hypothetical protein
MFAGVGITGNDLHLVIRDFMASQNHGQRKPQTVVKKMAAIKSYLGWRSFEGDRNAIEVLAVLNSHKVTSKVRPRDIEEKLRLRLRCSMWHERRCGFRTKY